MNSYLSSIKNKFISEIQEADSNPDKWYELFVDEGDDVGTHTVQSEDVFDNVVSNYELYITEYGQDNVHLDIWRNTVNPEIVMGLF